MRTLTRTLSAASLLLAVVLSGLPGAVQALRSDYTPYANSSSSGRAYWNDSVPDSISVYGWVGAAYVRQSVPFGTRWAVIEEPSFAELVLNQTASAASGSVLTNNGGHAGALAEASWGVAKASLQATGHPQGRAEAKASSEWGIPLLFSTPGNAQVSAYVKLHVSGTASYGGDTTGGWSFLAEFNGGGTEWESFASSVSVGGGTAPCIGGPPTRCMGYMGRATDISTDVYLPITFGSDKFFLSGRLSMEGYSDSDKLTRVKSGGDLFDTDGNGVSDNWVDRYVVAVEDTVQQGTIAFDFAHTVTVAGLYLPEGVTVTMADGSAVPFAVFSSPVPEPKPALMLLGGLALLVLWARRRLPETGH
jgi:MYXO-CTERM domain-containing protein